MRRDSYLLKYRLDGDDRYLLWYEGDPDGVVVDDGGWVLGFADASHLRAWADGNAVAVSDDDTPVLHDLDGVGQWSADPDPNHVDCVAILEAWNLFTDVRSSVERRNVARDEHRDYDLYDKVFRGNNLPAVTPEGTSYVPVWSDAEVSRLGAIMRDGLRFFRAHVRRVDPD